MSLSHYKERINKYWCAVSARVLMSTQNVFPGDQIFASSQMELQGQELPSLLKQSRT